MYCSWNHEQTKIVKQLQILGGPGTRLPLIQPDRNLRDTSVTLQAVRSAQN